MDNLKNIGTSCQEIPKENILNKVITFQVDYNSKKIKTVKLKN